MARLPNFLVIIRSEKLSGKGQGRGGRGAKKRTFRFGKKNVSFPKVETFRFADYRKEIKIAEVKYIPHNDENFVIPDDLYELYFQNGNKGWESLGMQSPDKGTLYYRVPKGALFWLKNKSKGKEEQVFFFKQKIQFFSFEINKDNEIYK